MGLVPSIISAVGSIFTGGSSSSSQASISTVYTLPGSGMKPNIPHYTRTLVPATEQDLVYGKIQSFINDNKDIFVYGSAAALLVLVLKK